MNEQPREKGKTIEKAILPEHKGTLREQDDIVIWTKFNIVLQAVNELTIERGRAGDATRQLRVITAEAVRRDMFGFSVREREPEDAQLWTWYEVLKQFTEGANRGAWEHVVNEAGESMDEKQYVEVCRALIDRGNEMPKQKIQVDPLDLLGDLVKPTSKSKEARDG
jgi:hypothetical protein